MNIDGITSATTPILECQALSLISNLEMEHSPSRTTTETNFTFIKSMKDLDLKVKFKAPNLYSLIITGSLHKYFHGINYNDFYYKELQEVKGDLFKTVYMDILELDSDGNPKTVLPQLLIPLNKLEVGINFILEVDDVEKFLRDNLLLHKNKPFTQDDGMVFLCTHERFQIKIYHKGRQFPHVPHLKKLVRFEIVFFTRELRRYKIVNLCDLIEEKMLPLFDRLKKEAQEIIFSDGINIHSSKNLSKKERDKLLTYTSAWWHNDFSSDKKASKSKSGRKNMTQKLYRLKKHCKEIFDKKKVGNKQLFMDALCTKLDAFLVENSRRR